jgi:hypothetical protein
VFYNIKLPKQDIYYILVPRYILYLRNLARVNGFEIYKDEFQNLETVFKESRVCESAICDLRFCNPRSAIANRRFISNHKSSVRDPQSLILEI